MRALVPGVPTEILALAGLGVLAWVWAKGGAAAAASSVAETAVETVGNVATGAVTGAVTGASNVVGIPTPSQTTTDPEVARWIIDHPAGGYLQASLWSSALALGNASFLDAGSGRPPPVGSDLYARFPPW